MKRRDFSIGILTAAMTSAKSGFASKTGSPPQASPSSSVPITGFVYDDIYLRHLIFRGHPESPERLMAIVREIELQELNAVLKRITPIDDALPFIRAVHTSQHIASISALPVTGMVAERAVAGVIAAVDAVDRGIVRNAFCAIRPPGHHALNTGQEEGFCFYNNVAVAARYAQSIGHKRILIIDWDYHHGNGTEAFFYEDPSVLFFSTHNLRAYPGTGKASRRGAGAGTGYNINVPMPCGTTDRDMIGVWKKHLLPAVASFKPDFIFVSAGFDSRENDPLGCFDVTDIGFIKMTKMAMAMAKEYCNGRLVSALEGGYNVTGLASAVCAHLKALAGLV